MNKQTGCSIFIGSGLMEKIPTLLDIKKYSKIFIITDQNTKPLFLKKLISTLPIKSGSIDLPSGEKAKNIESIKKIWEALVKGQYDRKSLVINLGGGVICDMGGFAASTFMRGLDFLNIPTTLLAQVDASVGGKTGIDFAGIKNLIGAFDQPMAVIVDVDALATLPKREFLSGFSEIIKHGLICNEKYFEKITSKHPLQFTDKELIGIIAKSIQIKADIIEEDETEENNRKILNFGHTVGHAIESLSLESASPLLHGEAVSIGMFIEAKISHQMKLIPAADLQLIKQSLINADLPVSVNLTEVDKVIKLMRSDKKNEKGKINFTLLDGIGKAIINQYVPKSIIKKELA